MQDDIQLIRAALASDDPRENMPLGAVMRLIARLEAAESDAARWRLLQVGKGIEMPEGTKMVQHYTNLPPAAPMKTTEDLAREAGMTRVSRIGAHDCESWPVSPAALERFAAAIRAQALEEAAQVCEAENLAEPAPYSEGDLAYGQAVSHCAAAIRALATPPNSVECIQAPEGTQCFQHYTNLGPGGLKAP